MGIITWGLISGVILDGAAAFVAAENLVRSVKLPYTVHILRVLHRNLIIFAHNLRGLHSVHDLPGHLARVAMAGRHTRALP